VAQIVMFGTGKVADVVYRHITHSAQHEIVAFTVDAPHVPDSGMFHGKPVVPFEIVAERFPPERYGMIVAIGYHDLNAVRKEKYDLAKTKGYRLISYVSPRAGVGDWLEMGDNCIVLDNAVIEPGARLGSNVVVWSNVLVGHHTTIEDHAWVAGQAVFGGSARLGKRSFVGLGAIIGHEVEIGEDSFLGAGVLLTKCCDPKSVFIGKNTDLFRLDSERFLKISKLR
jgi:sugar O-acyltransferase (sialic acid O-acetyltransferase NeuD family)